MLIDTHAHLDYPDFARDLDEVVENARAAGVDRIITIGTSVESSRRALDLAGRYDGVYAAVGIHPTSIPDGAEPGDFLPALRELAAHPKVVAIGETGLDYHRLPGAELRKGTTVVSDALGAGSQDEMQAEILDDACKARQARFFQDQLDLAAELGLNVIIHQRDAWQDTLDLLAPFDTKVHAVFHCFVNDPGQAAQLIDRGHLVSFTGIVTFKNAPGVREVAGSIPPDAYMVETDCPYLAPGPHRGKRCEPAHTRLVAEEIARVRNTSLEAIARATTATAEAFFRFPPGPR